MTGIRDGLGLDVVDMVDRQLRPRVDRTVSGLRQLIDDLIGRPLEQAPDLLEKAHTGILFFVA